METQRQRRFWTFYNSNKWFWMQSENLFVPFVAFHLVLCHSSMIMIFTWFASRCVFVWKYCFTVWTRRIEDRFEIVNCFSKLNLRDAASSHVSLSVSKLQEYWITLYPWHYMTHKNLSCQFQCTKSAWKSNSKRVDCRRKINN